MWALITSLAKAVELWLQLKVVSAQYDLRKRIEADVADYESQIEKLRATGLPADQLRADKLRDRVARLQGILAALSAPDSAAEGASTSPDA